MTLDDVYADLTRIVSEVGAQVDVPIEREVFFSQMLEGFADHREQFLDYVTKNVQEWFRVVEHGPRWLQEGEWQFSGGRPMVFVGQIDIPAARQFFHDDAAFFVFWNPETGETKTLVQVA